MLGQLVRRKSWADLLLVASLASILPAAAVNGPRSRSMARADIVRVQATGCSGTEKTRVGTGFAWHSAREVVTALHVVAGCRTATAYSERDQIAYPLTIARTLRRADLALMLLGDNGSLPPIPDAPAMPPAKLGLTAWGYGEGIPAMRSFAMIVAAGGQSLKHNVPADVATALQRTGSPALDIDVVPIDAVMAAGLSGAPLLDASGRVRAIADGGVAHGITHVSWAIPASYLAELVTSMEPTVVYLAPNANLSAIEQTRADVFSSDFVDPNAPSINCGTSRLRLVRGRSFAQASAGADSPLGLAQLINVFGGVAPQFDVDVYEDAESGATVAIPGGAALMPDGGACRAVVLGGQIEMRVQVSKYAAYQNPDAIASQFELSAATPPVQGWLPDPAWTLLAPFYRPDGLAVRRKAFGRFYPQNQFGLPTGYLFETLAARNGTFVGVAAIRHNDLAFNMCLRGIPGAVCPPPQYMLAWVQAALSVQLATFSITARNPTLSAWQEKQQP